MAPNTENRRAYAYRRTSSRSQDTFLSAEGQSRVMERYVRSEGLQIIETLTDIGSGLDTQHRPELLRMFAMALDPENNIGHIVFHDLSRLSRDKVDPHIWINTLIENGITVHSAEEGKSSDDYTEDYWDNLFISNNRSSRKVSRENHAGAERIHPEGKRHFERCRLRLRKILC